MATSEQLLRDYMEALAAEGLDRHALGDFEADLLTRVGRMRKRRDACIRDIEAARLLHEGPDVLMVRFGGCRSTQYARAKRGRTLSKACDVS